ncbi:unnamed protein product [Adineta steineri]|uniref:BBSome complex member BBS5 PH domain-containing protein n=1 Tax=Adineta steineri TaxID=433720 RepID=A0A814BR37_9BILA|nr:unnamed protein product [Adineta steineri]CAF4086197.1 unnamed protein product [Adineta steineri]
MSISFKSNLDIFHIIDVRLIWHAELNEDFNVSVPYYQTKTIKIRDSKVGLALVLETTLYFANPKFGVEFSIENQQSHQPATRLESKVDDIEILQSREHTDSYTTYLTDAGERD